MSDESCSVRYEILGDVIRLDTLSAHFADEFVNYRDEFLAILSSSYEPYFGDGYHLKRMIDGRSIAYIASVSSKVVGVSYVKRNHRRGVTAVYPEAYRRKGLAKRLIVASFFDFPDQFSILNGSNTAMVQLLLGLGFLRANSLDEVRNITGDEFSRLSRFTETESGLIFSRHSVIRIVDRESLILLYRANDVSCDGRL